MGRQVTLYSTRRDAQHFDVPLASIVETISSVAKLARGEKPFAVDVLVDDRVMMPTLENRQLVPPPCDAIVLVQNCSHDIFTIPNKSWRFE